MTKRVITFHYTLTDPSGEVIDSSQGHEPLSFIEGEDQIIPGLEATVITLAPPDNHVILDANHPLAGLDLTFDVELVEMRDATAEELAHGHVHGAGGHHH